MAIMLILDEVTLQDPESLLIEILLFRVLRHDPLERGMQLLGVVSGEEGPLGALMELHEAVWLQIVSHDTEQVDGGPGRLQTAAGLLQGAEEGVEVGLAV